MVFTLWDNVAQVTQKAITVGALETLNTSVRTQQDGELTFHIHILKNLKNKPRLEPTDTNSQRQPDTDPFLPHEQALFVSQVGDTHKCLLNKYNALNDHILLVTQAFEEQSNVLNQADFNALQQCLCAAPALAFYNSGQTAGASQRHKHLQLVKLPDQPEQLIAFYPQLSALHDEVPRTLADLPFRHAALALPPNLFAAEHMYNNDNATQLKQLYDRLRMTLGIEKKEGKVSSDYNLLITPDWMLMIPRSEECFAGLSLNALAFSGSILVKSEAQAQQIIDAGLANALTAVSSTRHGSD